MSSFSTEEIGKVYVSYSLLPYRKTLVCCHSSTWQNVSHSFSLLQNHLAYQGYHLIPTIAYWAECSNIFKRCRICSKFINFNCSSKFLQKPHKHTSITSRNYVKYIICRNFCNKPVSKQLTLRKISPCLILK